MDIDKCTEFTPSDSTKKCALDEDNSKCGEILRTCEEMSKDKCGDFTPSDNTKMCSLNNEKQKCEEVKKEENKTEETEKPSEGKSYYISTTISMIALLMSIL